jgi:hypothetical protein
MKANMKAALLYDKKYVGYAYFSFGDEAYILIDEMYQKLYIQSNTFVMLDCLKDDKGKLYLIDEVHDYKFCKGKNYHYYRKYNRQVLNKLGFLVLHKTYDSVTMQLLDYIEKKAKYEVYLDYHINENNTTSIDIKNQTLIEILTKGYRGNRLDVMVGHYTIWLFVCNEMLMIAEHINGKLHICPDYDKLLKIVSQIDRKDYTDVCLV